MARTVASLPAGSRITDYISLGVITKFFPLQKVREVLTETKRASVRERDLPAHVVVYYVIALALYMRSSYGEVLRCLLEGVQWLLDPSVTVKVAGKSGISQARSRLGPDPLRSLYEALVAPIAERRTKGAWYRQWRLISLDGSTLDVADTAENAKALGRPGASRGASAFPKLRFVALLENGTHVLWAARMSKYATDEITLARQVVPALRQGMLCLADRRNRRNGIVVRVIDYRLHNVPGSEPVYRLITTILDPQRAPAKELAALYHERWEIGVSSQGHIVQSVRD